MTILKKKSFLFIIASVICMLASLFFVGCGENDKYSNVSLIASSQNVVLYVGQEQELTFTINNYLEDMDNTLSFGIVDSSSGTSSSEVSSEHISLKVVSKYGARIVVSVTGVSSGKSSIYATTIEGLKQCVVDVTVKQYSKTFEVDQNKIMYIAYGQVLYPSGDYFVFDDGTTEKDVKFYYTNDERADLTGKEFTKINFNDVNGDKTISFLNNNNVIVPGSSQVCEYDGQSFVFLAEYTYKEIDELGAEVEVSIKKLTKVVALFGISENDVKLYTIEGSPSKLNLVDKDNISLELIANKNPNNTQTYYITMPEVVDGLVDIKFGYKTENQNVINFKCKNITNDVIGNPLLSPLVSSTAKVYELTIFTNSFASSVQTTVTLNVYYSFENGINFASSYDTRINYELVIPVDIKLLPEIVEVVSENKVVVADNMAENTQKEIFYNYYVSDYGWTPYYVNVYKTNSTYTGVKVEFNPELVNIKYDGRNFNTSYSFVMTDLTKPLYIRGVEGNEADTEGSVKFSVVSELFDETNSLFATMNYVINDGASSLTYTTQLFDPKAGDGAYISSSSLNNEFVDIYADKQYKYFTLETTTPGIASIAVCEPEEPVDGKYMLKFNVSPIKTGTATYVVRLDNGVSSLFKVTVVNTFDSLYVDLYGNNQDVVYQEYKNKDLYATAYEQVLNVVVRNADSFAKKLSLQISSNHNDAILSCEENFDYSSVVELVSLSINKNDGSLIRNYETRTKGSVNLTLTVTGVVVNNFQVQNNVQKQLLVEIISFVPVKDIGVYNVDLYTGATTKADKVVVYAKSTKESSRIAYLRADIEPSNTAYYFYDMTTKEYTGDKSASECLYWTLSDGMSAFDAENPSQKVDVLTYGNSYYISGRTTFDPSNYLGKFEYDFSLNCYKFTANDINVKANFMLYASIRQYGLKKFFPVQIECQEFVAVEQIYTTSSITQYAFKNVDEKLEFVTYLNPYEATEKGIKVLYVTNFGGDENVSLLDVNKDVTVTKLDSTTSNAYLISVKMRKEVIDEIKNATQEYSGTLYIIPLDWYNQNFNDLNGIYSSRLFQVLTITIKFQNGTRGNPFVLESAEDVKGIGASSTSMNAHYVVYDMIDMSGVNSYPVAANFSGSIRGFGLNAGFENVRITNVGGMFGKISTNNSYTATDDYYTLENLTFIGSISGQIANGGYIGLIAGECSANIMNVGVIIDEDSQINISAQAGADVGLMFGVVTNGSIFQDFKRRYINYKGVIYGSGDFAEDGRLADNDGQYFKLNEKYYKVANGQVIISDDESYPIINITKNLVFTKKQVVLNSTASQTNGKIFTFGGVAGQFSGTLKKVDNQELKLYNYASYTVYADMLFKGSVRTYYVGGLFGKMSGGTITGVLVGGNVKQNIEFSTVGSCVGGFVGFVDNAKVTMQNLKTRASVRGYTVGVFIGSINGSHGDSIFRNFIAEATDDGKVKGIDASFYVKMSNATSPNLPTNIHCGSSGSAAIVNDSYKSYMTSREFLDPALKNPKYNTTEERTTNEYYGDAVVIQIPQSASYGNIFEAKRFDKVNDGGLTVALNTPAFSSSSNGYKATFAYYYEAKAVYGENGLSYTNLITIQDLLDKYFNTLDANGDNYPFTISGESVLISSKSSNISIDINGNITIKGTGLAVVELSNLLNQKNIVKVYLYVIDYFNLDSYYNYINNINYEKATGSFSTNETYYTKNGENYIKVNSPKADEFGSYYVESQRTQELFYIDTLPLKNTTSFSVISDEVINVKFLPNMKSKIVRNGQVFNILDSGIINVEGYSILIADGSKFIKYNSEFVAKEYVKATGKYNPNETYYSYDPTTNIYSKVESNVAGNFNSYYVKVVYGQITDYEGGFFFSKRADAVTTKDSFDLFNLQANLSFEIDGVVYTFNLVNANNIRANYYEGATAILTDYASYVIVTGKASTDVVHIVSDTEEELYCELQDAKGNTMYEHVENETDALFNVTIRKLTGDNNFEINVEVNKNSTMFKDRFENNIYGKYKLKLYSSSQGIDGISKIIELVFEEQDVNTIALVSYNNLAGILEGKDTESEFVVPKQTGVLAVSISPIDADFDTIRIENDAINANAGSSTASFVLGYIDFNDNKFVEIAGGVAKNGGIEISKSLLETYIEDFSGTFYVEYLFGSYKVVNDAPVKINAQVFKNGNLISESSINLKINKKYELGLKLNGYEDKTMVARGLSYKLEVVNTGFKTDSLKITIPSRFITIASFVDDDGNQTYEIDDISKISNYKLQIANEGIVFDGISNVFTIELNAVYIDEFGKEKNETTNLELTVLEYVINYRFNEDFDIVSGMTNGVISTAIGEKTTLSIDFNNYSLIEYNENNEGVKEAINEFMNSLNKNGRWYSYIDVNYNGVQIFPNPITDLTKAEKSAFGGNSKLNNVYFSNDKLSFWTKRTHSIAEKHYLFTFEGGYRIINGKYVYTSLENAPYKIATEFTFDSFVRGSDEHPNPVYTYDDVKQMSAGAHYILMNDIRITADTYEPITTAVASFNGNGYSFIFSNYDRGENEDNNQSIFRLEDVNDFGVFANVQEDTVLKNITVQIGDASSGDVVFIMGASSSLTMGLVASSSSGVITNACVKNYANVNFTITGNSSSTSMFGGIVGSNAGFITNSRSLLSLTASFNIGGVVGSNSGRIASSFFKNGVLKNNVSSTTTSIFTAGFVVTNSGVITTSFTSGEREDIKYSATEVVDWNKLSFNIDSNVQAAGFVYRNMASGSIQDCYSNMPISSKSQSAGFVYVNEGSCQNDMSFSLVNPNSNTDYGFAGGDSIGKFSDCYYIRSEANNINKSQNFTTISGVMPLEPQNFVLADDKGVAVTDAGRLENFKKYSYVIGDSKTKTWKYMTSLGRLELVDANIIAFSQEEIEESLTEVLDDGTYKYYYKTSKNCSSNGAVDNPYVLSTVAQFKTYLANKDNTNKHYRLVCDLDFSGVATDYITSYDVTFGGNIYGNGMTIKNINIYSTEQLENAGLFAEIVGSPTESVFVKDLTIMPTQVSFANATCVGTLAGRISYCDITNVKVYGSSTNQNEDNEDEDETLCVVIGKNIVGGLVGRTDNRCSIDSVSVKISVLAKKITLVETYILPTTEETVFINAYKSLTSYAGGVVGFLGGNANVKNIEIVHANLTVIGSSAGLGFGFVGKSATVDDIRVKMHKNMLIRAFVYGGLITGGTYGRIENIDIRGNDQTINIFSAIPNVPTSIGGVAGVASGATIENVNMEQSFVMPSQEGITITSVQNLGGIVGEVCASLTANTKISKVLMTASLTANQNLGGIVGQLTTSTTLTLDEIAIRQGDKEESTVPVLTVCRRTPRPVLGGFVGYCGGNVFLTDSYSKAQMTINAFEYDTGINAYVGEIAGQIDDISKIKLVKNVYVSNDVSGRLEDKSVTENEDTLTFNGGRSINSIDNVINEKMVTAELFSILQKDNKHSVEYVRLSSTNSITLESFLGQLIKNSKWSLDLNDDNETLKSTEFSLAFENQF